jgi:CPA2 family monovalent cation:H+ antiporter-2
MEASQPAQPAVAPDAAPTSPPDELPPPAVVIVGFGLPGRFVAEVLDARRIPYCIVELNPVNAKSIAACRKRVICGDARSPELLRQAGVEQAQLLCATIPDERIVVEVLNAARQINPNLRMLARVHYTSTGIKAEKAGAEAVVVEEQIVALEFAKMMSKSL